MCPFTIDDTLFMHGGPSRVLSGLALPEINRRYRAALHGYLAVLEPLRTAGLVLDVDPFARRPELAAQRLQALPPDTSPQRAALAEAVGRFVEADRDPMLERDGPNWYRGAALCNACAEADVLRPILQQLGVRRVVIGHTVARNRTVATRFDGAVIKLDAGMNRAVYGGRPAALVIERGEERVLYGDGPSPPAAIGAEGRYVTHEAIEDGRIVELLGSGNVTVGPAPIRRPGS